MTACPYKTDCEKYVYDFCDDIFKTCEVYEARRLEDERISLARKLVNERLVIGRKNQICWEGEEDGV